MRIGYKNLDGLFYFMDNEDIIQHILLFDKVVVTHGPWAAVEAYNKISKNPKHILQKKKKIDDLENHGLIESIIPSYNIDRFNPTGVKEILYYLKLLTQASNELKDFVAFTKNIEMNAKVYTPNELLGQLLWRERLATNANLLADTAVYNHNDIHEWIPIIHDYEEIKNRDLDSYTVSLSVILKNIPTIPSDISLTQLKEFKSDTDARTKFLALRNFIVTLSKENLTSQEIQERIEFLLNEYEQQLKLHKSKLEQSTLQIFLTTTAEVIENIAQLKLSTAIGKIFDIQNKEIQLLEAERNFVGREVAYIHKIKTELVKKL